ncbi:hypothetical protein FOZ62_031843 [Perkinsus olseni]|uniref:Uncharacterized protein n=1 Tax=Perkinsus olseni TaxID=32597 RepID=A0A7J6SNK6_PEROL|nr:hypothetical protein FOZ62_031843 [Perkinsus olseni]
MRKRPRTAAEGSVVSVTQSMHDYVQHIIDVTPQSAITLSSCSADPGPMQALDDVNRGGVMTGFEDEGAVNEGDTSLVAAAVRAVSGREVVLERDGSTFTAEIVEGDPPSIGFHGVFLVWRDPAGAVFASVRPEGFSSGELNSLAQSLKDDPLVN